MLQANYKDPEKFTSSFKIGMYLYLSMDVLFLSWLFYGILIVSICNNLKMINNLQY